MLSTIKRKVKRFLLNSSANNPRFATLSNFVSPDDMIREVHAVAYGRLRHQQLRQGAEGNMFQLRRNVHRIEKGLIMKERRAVFGADYIEEAVEDYAKLRKDAFLSDSSRAELQWAHDVLKQYFEVTGSEPRLDRARAAFLVTEAMDDCGQVPYKRDLSDDPVSPEAFHRLCYRRRSVRWYLDRPVPRELVDAAMVDAALSPSACNRQPFEFRVFDDPELTRKVSAIPMGTKGFHQNFPMIIVVVGQLRAYFHPRDRHVIYVDGALASMSLMLALETRGLSSCPINWPDIPDREEAMRKALNLEPDQRVVMLISVGYPDPEEKVPYSGKKHLDNIRSYNRVGKPSSGPAE